MALKDIVLNPDEPGPDAIIAPRRVRQSEALWRAYAAQHNERYAKVATCPECNEGLIAEELLGHAREHVSDAIRSVFTMAMQLEPDARGELTDALLRYSEAFAPED